MCFFLLWCLQLNAGDDVPAVDDFLLMAPEWWWRGARRRWVSTEWGATVDCRDGRAWSAAWRRMGRTARDGRNGTARRRMGCVGDGRGGEAGRRMHGTVKHAMSEHGVGRYLERGGRRREQAGLLGR
jgi:hypothetical protein